MPIGSKNTDWNKNCRLDEKCRLDQNMPITTDARTRGRNVCACACVCTCARALSQTMCVRVCLRAYVCVRVCVHVHAHRFPIEVLAEPRKSKKKLSLPYQEPTPWNGWPKVRHGPWIGHGQKKKHLSGNCKPFGVPPTPSGPWTSSAVIVVDARL